MSAILNLLISKMFLKIMTLNELATFRRTGCFYGNAMDITSGFIHMSATNQQCRRVIDKYYANVPINIVTLNPKFVENVKMEPISNGDLYPHVYGTIPFTAVVEMTSSFPPHNFDSAI